MTFTNVSISQDHAVKRARPTVYFLQDLPSVCSSLFYHFNTAYHHCILIGHFSHPVFEELGLISRAKLISIGRYNWSSNPRNEESLEMELKGFVRKANDGVYGKEREIKKRETSQMKLKISPL